MRILISVLLIWGGFTAGASALEPVHSLPCLPDQYRENKAQEIANAFEQRATLFLKGRNFKAWKPNKSREELAKEFDELNDWRYHAWYVDPAASTLISRADFMVAQDLLEKGYYRQAQLIAFQYNQTDGSYNSSTIILNGFKFLALEAPTAKNIKNFLTLLLNYQVTDLVRLTPEHEQGKEKSFAYWKGKLGLDAKNKTNLLKIPQGLNPKPYNIRYYSLETWQDDQGISAKALLDLIQSVRKNYDISSSLLACHSTNGVGRTGTFLAGFMLINDIDRQLAAGVAKENLDISIEKTVMQLSLQRPYMVGKKEQYITLYRLIDLYLQSRK